MKTLNRIIARLRTRAAGEEGFSLIEVMVAVVLLAMALLALARTATVAFTDVAAGRQRQTASQLANQLIEEVRALPYDSIKRGLKTNQLGGDPNVVNCTGTYYLRVCPPDPTAEKIVHATNTPNTKPLMPHSGTVGPPDVVGEYDWNVYVTEMAGAPTAGAYRIIATVSWNPPQRSGVRSSVEAQTLLYGPTGSVDESSHPFVGPRSAYFFASAQAGGGSMDVTGAITGATYDTMGVDLLQSTSSVQTEQSIRAEGTTYLPGLAMTVSGVETTAAGLSEASLADLDPVTTAGTYDRKNLGPQPYGTLSVVGSTGNTLLGWVDGQDSGESTSTTAAGGSNACNLQTDNFPCSFGSSIMPDGGNEAPDAIDTWDTSLQLTVPNIGTADLFRVGSTTTPSTTYARRTGTGPSGLARGTVSWNLPEIRIGGLPALMRTPQNWAGYWIRLTGFTATAQAESGPGAATPSVTLTGTLEYRKGNNYESKAVSTTGGRIKVDNVTASDNNVGVNRDQVTVTITGNVAGKDNLITEKTATSRTTSGSATTEATAQIGAPITGQFTYKLDVNGVTQANLTISFTAGRARASASYRAGPTG